MITGAIVSKCTLPCLSVPVTDKHKASPTTAFTELLIFESFQVKNLDNQIHTLTLTKENYGSKISK